MYLNYLSGLSSVLTCSCGRSFDSVNGLGQHCRYTNHSPASDADDTDASDADDNRTEAGVDNVKFECVCGRVFKNRIGL
jgi:hypothetical protein